MNPLELNDNQKDELIDIIAKLNEMKETIHPSQEMHFIEAITELESLVGFYSKSTDFI